MKDLKFEIKKDKIEYNGFNYPVKLYDTIRIYLDLNKSELIDTCFVVLRDISVYTKEIQMFNDTIFLVDENNNILDYQKCDSTAGLNPVADWSKKDQDAYTLATGIYDIRHTFYKEHNAFELLGGFTKGGFKIGTLADKGNFSLRHLIHYIAWNDNVSEIDIKKADTEWFNHEGYRSGSGGCITIPKRTDGKNSILDYKYVNINIPKYVIIFEY
jgi:hypothetical protein